MPPTCDAGRPFALRAVARSVLLSLALAGCALTTPASRDALSQAAIAAAVGPDGPYRGTLPCADCAGIATELTLYRDTAGRPARYRLRTTYLSTRDGDRRADAIGAWQEVTDPARIRLDPQDDAARRNFLRIDADTLELLDRSERKIASGHDHRLRHDRARAAPPLFDVVRPLFAGTLRRARAGWQFAPCRERLLLPARDVSPESMITAVLTDLGFDRRDGIYIEAFGRVIDGVVQFERLNRTGSEMGCPSPAATALHWQAQGNEPFWAVRLHPAGARDRRAGRAAHLALEQRPGRSRPGRRRCANRGDPAGCRAVAGHLPRHDGRCRLRFSRRGGAADSHARALQRLWVSWPRAAALIACAAQVEPRSIQQ